MLILLLIVVLVMAFSSIGNDDELQQSLIATASAMPDNRPSSRATNTLQPTPTMLAEIDGTVIVPTELPASPLPPSATPDPNLPTVDPNTTLHVVSSGDTLYSIAVSYGVTVQDIVNTNPDLNNPSAIFIGQEIRVPVVTRDTEPDNIIIDESGAIITETPYVVYVIVTPVSPGSDGSSVILEEPNALSNLEITIPVLPPLDDVPDNLNGVPNSMILQMSPEVIDNVQQIYIRGQALGRNPQAFSKVGDSTIENPHFLSRFDSDTDPYNLGDYGYLQGVIDHFAGSFERDSIAVRVGLHSWSIFDQFWAPNPPCEPNEGVFECEIRLNNPSVILIRLGSNDAGVPEYFRENVVRAVEYATANGVIPVIGTKADRVEGADINNAILREIATEYQIPLWDWDMVASTIPGKGLLSDGVHMTTFYLHDYSQPEAFQRGHTAHSLSALIMLDGLLRSLSE